MVRRPSLSASLSVISIALGAFPLVAGCSEDTQATPRVALETQVIQGSHPRSECSEVGGTWFTIGTFGNPARGRVKPEDPESPLIEPVVPKEDGEADQQGTVGITCSVKERGDGFDVSAHAELSGATGGSFTVEGFFRRDGEQTGINVIMVRKGIGYSQKGCVAKYNTAVGQSIASGRVWAGVECPNATNEQGTTIQTCTSIAQFRFENCSQ